MQIVKTSMTARRLLVFGLLGLLLILSLSSFRTANLSAGSPVGAGIGPADETEPGDEDTGGEDTGDEAEEGTGTITGVYVSGQVIHSSDLALPEDMEVTLESFDHQAFMELGTATVDPEGYFEFSDVEVSESALVILATVEYSGLLFYSDYVEIGELAATKMADLLIEVQEISSDTSALSIAEMYIFFDITGMETMSVIHFYTFNNPTDQLIADDAEVPALAFPVPPDATNFQFEDTYTAEQFVNLGDSLGYKVIIYPQSQAQALFVYDVPYTASGSFFSTKPKRTFTFSAPRAAAEVMVAVPVGVEVKGDGLESTGIRDMQDFQVEVFSVGALEAGQTFEVELVGNPLLETHGAGQGGWNSYLTYAAAGLGVLLVVGGGWYFLRQLRKEPEVDEEENELVEDAEAEEPSPVEAADFSDVEDTKDALLDAIVALDEAYESGVITPEVYEEQRADLKERLKKAVD